MKQRILRDTALLLCTVLLFSMGAYAAEGGSRAPLLRRDETEPADRLPEQNRKEETVYVIAGADGAVQKVLVSTWIKNDLHSEQLRDVSELAGVETVKGDCTYTMDGENLLVWDARGADVYYRGESSEALPVALYVSYRLNGTPVDPAELAGKSGSVTIRFDYDNRQYETVTIDGEEERIYVPFLMATGVLLDGTRFSNVQVTGGRVISDGSRLMVGGVALPGLRENLGLDPDLCDLPDHVEITADVEDFSLGTTFTLASNEIFNQLDPDGLSSLDGLTEQLGRLSAGMSSLLEGSAALAEGLSALQDRTGDLISGVSALTAGAGALEDGADRLGAGAERLTAGANSLAQGLDTLSANGGSLVDGAGQVFEGLLSAANTQLAAAGLEVPTLTAGNYSQVLTGVIGGLDETAAYQTVQDQVIQAVEAQRDFIAAQVTEAVRQAVTQQASAQVNAAVAEQVTAQVTANRAAFLAAVVGQSLGMTAEQYAAAVSAGAVTEEQQAAVEAAVEAVMAKEIETRLASEAVQAQISAAVAQAVEEQMATEGIRNTIEAQTELQVQKTIAETMAGPEVQAKLQAAAAGAAQVIALKTSLDSYNGFYLGLKTYTAGVDSAAGGAAQLRQGLEELNSGAQTLEQGAKTLHGGLLTLQGKLPALAEGVSQLVEGSHRLADGLTEFDREGVQRLIDAAQGDVAGLLTRVRATVEVSRRYTTFSGRSEDMSGTVRFIYRTDAIEGGGPED